MQALLEYNLDEETYLRYDRLSARELFRTAGVSGRLYREFLEPMLLVTLFAPGEELSAAAALGERNGRAACPWLHGIGDLAPLQAPNNKIRVT